MKKKEPPNNIVSIIDGAKKPKKDNGKNSEKTIEISISNDYFISGHAFYQIINSRNLISHVPLCDFVCWINEEIIADDGLTDTSFVRIEGIRNDIKNTPLPMAEVSLKHFYSSLSNWPNEAWGSLPFIYPGNTKRDHLRAAIHLYSKIKANGDIPRQRIYRYTGWKKINDSWHYLSGSGAITSQGLIHDVQVDLGHGHMANYTLPDPLIGDPLIQAATEMLTLLDVCPNKKHIGVALLAAIARAPLGECHCTDYVIWLHGPTGSKKSSIAALALAAFGDFTARTFPANWSDTITDAEAKSHQAKDAVFIVDDFKPSTSLIEANKIHAMAERLIRGTGNQQGRGRRNGDMTSRPAPHNRSLTISTGEDLPRGQSIIGRMLIIELSKNDVDNASLTRLQRAAAAGQFSGLMSAYLQWLTPRIDQLKRDFPKRIEQTRNAAIADGVFSSHPRAPENYANMIVALSIFLDFLQEKAGLGNERTIELETDADAALRTLFKDQESYIKDQDEVERFLQLTRAALSSGCCHIAYSINQKEPPSHPFAWGWRSDGVDAAGDPILKPLGDCIGWFYENEKSTEVWLQQETTYKIIQQFARSSGEVFLMSHNTLWKRLYERGFIKYVEKRVERTNPRLSVKRVVTGRVIRVMILEANLLILNAKDIENEQQ